MISFSCRPDGGLEWSSVAFSGDQEDLLSHLFATFLANAGWEFIAQDAEGRELEWEDA